MSEFCPTSMPQKMVEQVIGKTVGDVREALYRFGIRTKPLGRSGRLVTPDYYNEIDGVPPDDRPCTDDESISLQIAVRFMLAEKFSTYAKGLTSGT